MKIFDSLLLWLDPVFRPGPEAMAVDEWLLETALQPVLRVYGWSGKWGTLGYFGSLAEAQAAFPPEMKWVRRWTGGGTVDHRTDWTYTVVAPAGEGVVRLRGAESYRVIHAALARALAEEGYEARLSTGSEETGASLCFENPVSHDLVGMGNRKLAGAGQRRTANGLVHQGSVAMKCEQEASVRLAERLAGCLSESWERVDFSPPVEQIEEKVLSRYALPAWTQRM